MIINPYSIGPSISGLGVFTLGVYVLSKDIKNPLNRAFFFSVFSLTIWLSFYGVIYNAPHFANTYSRIAYCGITFIPITFFDFVSLWTQLSWTKYWRIFNYTIGIIECLLIVKTNLIVSGTYQYFFGVYPKAGSLHPYYLIYFIFLLSFQVAYLLYYWRKSPIISKKNQTKLFLLGYLIISFACLDFIPNYGVEIYPPGFLCALIFALIIAYAIFRHNMLGIKTFISNSIVYSILITFIFLVYTIAVLILEKSVQKYFGYKSLGLSIISAFLIGLLIIPLRNSIQKLIDIAVLKGSPIQISNENALLRQELTNADKLRSVAILASSLAHEIKNPVTTINTFADYLPSKQNDPEFLNKCRNTLLSETSRIQNLLSQLLSFAKPSPPVFILVNPTSLIDEVLLLLEHKCRKGNITLTRGYTTKEEILADPNQLKQALINILFNAIEAMPNGGKLQISTSCEETTYTIAIKDTGIGIKPESLNKIFEPFFTSKNNGVGLGLAITQEIIAHHLGKISVKSTVGTGTHFFIALPKESQGKNHAS